MRNIKKVVLLLVVVVIGSLLTFQIVKAAYPTPPSLESEVFVQGGNGFGSGDVFIRRYTNTIVNVGSDITYTDSATNGATFTINTNGLYAMTLTDWAASTADGFGVSVDATPSAAIPTDGGQLCSISSGPSLVSGCSATAYLNANDAVRAHWGAGNVANTVAQARFIIVKVK